MAPITVVKGRQSGTPSPSTKSDPDPNTQNQESSFTQIPDEDLEAIGRHCKFEYCNQLDFLPFRCESCRRTFCLEHRTETAHKCPQAGEWARRRRNQNAGIGGNLSSSLTQRPTIYNTDQCAHLSCKTLINTLKDPAVRCPNCNRQYCLKHRLQEEHDCAKVVPLGGQGQGQQSANASETIRSMFAKVRTWGKDKIPTTGGGTLSNGFKGKSSTSGVGGLNALKRTAKGDPAIVADKRLYLHVVGSSDTQKTEPPTGDFFFDSRWKVGRVLDEAARRLHVENLNNRGGGEEERLRVFHVESGEFLEFSESIGGGKVKQGHTLVLLRGAGVLLGKS
ncbi:hypothetical protein MPDQ_004032 [Monascus purpureus]|uniref:AN1-type domain-containing protein n=1 Tax=Monascus purpureus TaxID=5098 RepID=A0A507QHV6_MONPU|nr:hypothetical protein MPDQ_004032 [Monascus purpureus]BDD54937.1 hypothetical protein MAP00_000504 [Monascus purpureus]